MYRKVSLFFVTIIVHSLTSILQSTLAIRPLNTSSGIYVGRTIAYGDTVVQQYLGIQYGLVHKRFDRAVANVRTNDDLIDATDFGPVCKPSAGSCVANVGMFSLPTNCSVSYGIFAVRSAPKEQCLFLNAFIPVTSKTASKKAIFMWIHGGSGQIGTGDLFDGTVLAALGDIIVVTFNFRLNLFGFLSSGDARLEGNLGLYDQALALDWIYDNADAMGGDRTRITAGGHSAGAPHAYYLSVSPFSRGRVRRLLLQSGSPFNVWSHLKAGDAMEKFNIVVRDNGCGARRTFEEQLQCLEDRDFDSLTEQEHHSYTSANHTNVVLAGEFMSHFREQFEQNDTATNMDLLIGSADDEAIYVAVVPIFMEQNEQDPIRLNNVNYTAIALKFLSVMLPDKACLHHQALQLYHIDQIPADCFQSSDCFCSAFYNYSRLASDILFDNDFYRFMVQRVKYSNRTYVYRYSQRTAQEHQTICSSYLHKRDVVGHFAELEYTWGTPFLSEQTNATHNLTSWIKFMRYGSNITTNTHVTHVYTPQEIQFSKQLIEQWSNFIKDGRPSSMLFQDRWQPIRNLSSGTIMHLRVNHSVIEEFTVSPTVQFWLSECPTDAPNPMQKKNRASTGFVSWALLLCTPFLNRALSWIN